MDQPLKYVPEETRGSTGTAYLLQIDLIRLLGYKYMYDLSPLAQIADNSKQFVDIVFSLVERSSICVMLLSIASQELNSQVKLYT